MIERMRDHRYAVYIMASRSHNLYIGVTNDMGRHVREHKNHTFEGFTHRYNVDRLVWYKIYGDVRDAIAREKQLKGWVRAKKIRLIEALNPTWQDLSEGWGKPIIPLRRTPDPSATRPPDPQKSGSENPLRTLRSG